VAVAALVVSLVALGLSAFSVLYTRAQARAATSADLRARHPVLGLTLHQSASAGETTALYYLENQGAEDLDSVVVFRPETADGVDYPVARLGQDFADEAELGPLGMKAKQAFVLCIGPAEMLPEFRVRIRCRIGKDSWEDAYVLDDPRFHIGIY